MRLIIIIIMKFTAAFAAFAAAEMTTLEMPTVSWDKQAVEAGAKTMESWYKTQEKMDVAAVKNVVRNLGKVAAYHDTAKAVAYAKNVKPFANLWVQWLNAITVDAKCDVEAAHMCVYKYWGVEEALSGKPVRHDNAEMKACLKKANCQMNWEKLTPAQQQAAKAKFEGQFKAAVQNWHQSEQDIQKALEAKVTKGIKQYQMYERASYAVWGKYASKFAKDMHCDAKCVDGCLASTRPHDENSMAKFHGCLEKCPGCMKDVVNVDYKPKKAMKLAAIEETFGSVDALEDADFQDISASFEMAGI